MASTPLPEAPARPSPRVPSPRLIPLGPEPPMRGRGLPQAGAVIGHYILLRRLAHGNMGVVYEAIDRDLQRKVALKMLRNDLDVTEEDRSRFRVESNAMARLRHQGIVPVYEVGTHEGIDYFTMELIEGESFDAWLRQKHRTFRERVAIVAQISQALAHAHANGVVHRDLKPANILIDEAGIARVSDFGLARTLDGQTRLTDPGRTVGTPAYMSPEQAQGLPVDERCDLWGVGAILYEALTGRPPYAGETPYAVMSAVVADPALPPRKLDRAIPRELEAITLQCLEKEPRRRYASAQDLADDVGRWLAGEPVRARRNGPLMRGLRRLAKHRLVALLALATVLVALAFLVYWQLERRWAHADWIGLYAGDFVEHPGDLPRRASDTVPAGVEYLGLDLASSAPPWTRAQDGLHAQLGTWLWLKELRVPGDVRVTAVVRMSHPDGLEICIDSRREQLPRDGWVPTGYSCQFAGYGGTVDLISRNPIPRMADINSAVDTGYVSGRDQTVVFERRGERLTLSVDGALRASDEDPLPLTGSRLDGILLRTWCRDLVLRSLTVERLALPEKASPLIVGDALVQAGDYADAVASYLATARDHPGGSTAELALTKAYFATMRSPDPDPAAAATIRQALDRSFPSSRYQSRLLELDALHAWNRGDFATALDILPSIYANDRGARTAVRLLSAEHPHLSRSQGHQLVKWLGATAGMRELDLSQLDLDQLDGLEPLALRRLAASSNRIASLAPLARMPLRSLDISRNLVQSLEPVGGLPLSSLLANDNLVDSVAPLVHASGLASLDIRANAIPTLAPLRSLPLTHLDAGLNPLSETPTPDRQLRSLILDRCGLWDLSPLAHSRLTSLDLSGNRIHDLSPLAGLPLVTVDLTGNRIADLAPLSACALLRSATVADNQVSDLAPLLQPALTAIYCEDNRIHDLAPLRGHHLVVLRCAGNPIASLAPLLEDPPESFLYDDGAFPLDEIARAGARWRHDGRTRLARQTEVLLAARHGDIKALLRLAHRARGHAYLMVPMALTWEDASARAQALGGHLASITDAEQLGEVAADGDDEDVWIGLRIAGSDTRWDDGTPLQFHAFPYSDIHQFSGPAHMICTSRMWLVRTMPRTRLPFIVAWDDVAP